MVWPHIRLSILGFPLAVLTACGGFVNEHRFVAIPEPKEPTAYASADTGTDCLPFKWYPDDDGDGFGGPFLTLRCAAPEGHVNNSLDCDDDDADSFPGNVEIWYDGIDGDCSGGSDYDQDIDGVDALIAGGSDCNDLDASAIGCGTATAPALSCAQLLIAVPATDDGVYWIDPFNNGAFEVVCDMHTDGGGWIVLAVDETDGLFTADNIASPLHKCDDDIWQFFSWIDTEAEYTVDAQATVGPATFDFSPTYTRPDTSAHYTQRQASDLRAWVSELSSTSRMIAITADDDGGNSHNVYIGDEAGQFALLTPGQAENCGTGVNWPQPGSESGFYVWHTTALWSGVSGSTGAVTSADLAGIPTSLILPKTVRLRVSGGGGAAFGWESQQIRVR